VRWRAPLIGRFPAPRGRRRRRQKVLAVRSVVEPEVNLLQVQVRYPIR